MSPASDTVSHLAATLTHLGDDRPARCPPTWEGPTPEGVAGAFDPKGLTMTDHEKTIERIRGLLAKAASSEFDAEREAFEAKAMTLMAEHEIAERDLQTPSSIDQSMIDLTSFGRAGKGAACLAAWTAELLGGYAVLVSFRDGKSGRVQVYCTSTQRDRLDVLLDHLLPQLRAALTKDKPRSRMSYSLAWAVTVSNRLRESQSAATTVFRRRTRSSFCTIGVGRVASQP